MAKVTAPLQSFSAAGKVADSLIFQTHNGRNVVRKYFQPRNPRSVDQRRNRVIISLTSQSISSVDSGLPYLTDLLTVVPPTQTWSTYIHKYVTSRFGRGLAGCEALRLDYAGHPNRALIDNFSARIDYRGFFYPNAANTEIFLAGGISFYLLAEIAFEIKATTNLFNRPVYDTALNDWTLTHATAFKSDFTRRIPSP